MPDATLVASALGEGTGGGLFALEGGELAPIDRLSTTGMAVNPTGTRLARLLWTDEDTERPGELLVHDEGGLLLYRRIDALREPHGALWQGDRLVVVSTLTNSIVWLDGCGDPAATWSAPGDGDCWHLNNLLLHDGRLLVSAFGRFERHRGWADGDARVGRGMVLDVDSGTDVLRELDCPHDPLHLDGSWLVCNSGAQELLRIAPDGDVLARRALGGWTRGVAYDNERIYVGVSAHRLAVDTGRRRSSH